MAQSATVTTFEAPMGAQFVKLLGTGTFGSVAKFRDIKTNAEYAIKRIENFATMAIDANLQTFYTRRIARQIAMLKCLNEGKCPCVVQIIRIYLSRDGRDVYIQMKFVEQDLQRFIGRNLRMDESIIREIMRQMLLGVKTLHEHGFMHRDLTPTNVLIDADKRVYLADFGVARSKEHQEERATLDVVTLEYRAPEILLYFAQYDDRVDVWSVAVIVVEMFLKRRLFQPEKRDAPHQVRKLIQVLGRPDMAVIEEFAKGTQALRFVRECVQWMKEQILLEEPFHFLERDLTNMGASADAVDLLKSMLAFDFRKRLTVEQALAHAFFRTTTSAAATTSATAPQTIAHTESQQSGEATSAAGIASGTKPPVPSRYTRLLEQLQKDELQDLVNYIKASADSIATQIFTVHIQNPDDSVPSPVHGTSTAI